MPKGKKMRWTRLLPLLPAAALALGGPLPAAAAGLGGTAQAGFASPIAMPGSSGLGEPSLAFDRGTGNLYVTAPPGVPSGSGSPIWTSADHGATWGAPVNPAGDPLAGGDDDLVIDGSGDVFQSDLWLGNSAMALSTDHGQSFVANEWGHAQPGDDRPWLAYDSKGNTLFMTWDGVDAVHVGRTLPLSDPHLGMTFPQDVPAIPECLIGGQVLVGAGPVSVPNPCDGSSVRGCVCPPGGIATDPATGNVYISFSRQNGPAEGGGVGIGTSTDGGLQWTFASVPNTGTQSSNGDGSGSAFDTEFNFDPIAVDSAGTVYVAWAEGYGPKAEKAGDTEYAGGVRIRYAYSTDHGSNWSQPVTLSTSATSVFPTLDVVAPGTVDVAYYGTDQTGTDNDGNPSKDPNFAKGPWNLYLAQVTQASTPSPLAGVQEAVAGMHTGCIQSGGSAQCADRSLLDFFQLRADSTGAANIIYTGGQLDGPPDALGNPTPNTMVFFTKQLLAPPVVTPEAPLVPALVVLGAIPAALAGGRWAGGARRAA